MTGAVAEHAVVRAARVATVSLSLALFAGCSAPKTDLAPTEALERADALTEGGDARAGARLLRSVPDRDLLGEELAHHTFLLARALHLAGDSWSAFKTIQEFPDRHRFSEWLPEVQDLELEIGRTLIRSDGGGLFTSDAGRGVRVLRHFRQRYPSHRGGAEALRLLGERAFALGEYLRAAERFRQLLGEYPLSEWEPLASFRLAMCRFLVLQGPEYDQRAMEIARTELIGYLELDPERPEFRSEAERALATVDKWLAERQMLVADFYRRIGNARGERVALEELLTGFPESDQAASAKLRLARLTGSEDTGRALRPFEPPTDAVRVTDEGVPR